jgi:hypothetical protein
VTVDFVALLGFAPGDVVSIDAEEHWLEGAWLLAELATPVAALFFARDATIGALVAERPEVFRLAPCALAALADPPHSLEHDAALFERMRRVPVAVTAFGDAPEPAVREGLFLDYRAPAGRALWVLASAPSSRAWHGESVAHVERWGLG